MKNLRPDPVGSVEQLRQRVERALGSDLSPTVPVTQFALPLEDKETGASAGEPIDQNIREFVDFIGSVSGTGDVYVFGGMIRDLALYGKRGFSSDIDLVVEGDWEGVSKYIATIGGKRNKFGGFRLWVDGWPVDVWNAKETWAVKEGYVEYRGVGSLTETTILNWDAILMNWRTRGFIFRDRYFEELENRILDVVLEKNPNPKGMAVRVFRHLCLKDAKRVSPKAARYLSQCAKRYSFQEINASEIKSYGEAVIDYPVHRFFEELDVRDGVELVDQWSVVSRIVKKELGL